jgi:GTP-binding protein HflX
MDFLFELVYERDVDQPEVVETVRTSQEKAILVGLGLPSDRFLNGRSEADRSLDELQELSRTAGLVVLEKIMQRRASADAAFYIGRGKVDELGLMVQALGADTLVFDDELSGAQVRNIENLTGAKVIDRTTLILDIFAQRARSSEGKLQVELAQLKYRLPRLTGFGGQLSRLGGGIGTRGPGEKKLEVDRRHIRRRISALEAELANIGRRRGLIRESRKQNRTPVIALAGYTNSGKSTLMNRLCGTDVFAEDRLFATLDPTTRRFELPDGRNALLVDTVGFIRKLPHDLVEAFKSTLEEVVFADLLLHVVDASDEEAEEHIAVAGDILKSLGAFDKPSLMVLNKMDRSGAGLRLPALKPGINAVEVSALTGLGTGELINAIARFMPADEVEFELLAPYSEGWVIPYIHENGKLLSEEYTEKGMSIKAKIKRTYLDKLREFKIGVK